MFKYIILAVSDKWFLGGSLQNIITSIPKTKK